MQIATWNLNHRVGKTRYKPEAAIAAAALMADALVLTEFYAQDHEADFLGSLARAGWAHQEVSAATGEVANRVVVVAKTPIKRLTIAMPAFDQQFTANVLPIQMATTGVSVIGIRIPWYRSGSVPLMKAWDWLEAASEVLSGEAAIIVGDLNAHPRSTRSRGGDHLRRMLQSGWHRAVPTGRGSYFNSRGETSEIDHLLGNACCRFENPRYVTEFGGHVLAGCATALSDHSALVSRVIINN